MEIENESQPTELTEEQMDTLVAETDSPTNQEIPMTAQKEEAAPAEKPENFLEFTHNGKPIKAPVEQVVKWAQMGYDYPQKMQAFNQQRQSFEAQQKEFESKFAPYRQIDEWAQKNPQQWQQIENLYRQNQIAPAQPGQPQIDPLVAQKLNAIESFIGEMKSEKQKEYIKSQDEALNAEMKSIRETYKDLDFDTPNEEGKSLDYQILEYAKNNGIRSYKTAFRDFYHDQLIARTETLSKQAVSKGIQKNTKMGVLGSKNPTQPSKYSEPKSISQQSYDDLAEEALAELRASS